MTRLLRPFRIELAMLASAARCFVVPCWLTTEWLVNGVRDLCRSTVPTCRRHLIELLSGRLVDGERLCALPARRTRSVDGRSVVEGRA